MLRHIAITTALAAALFLGGCVVITDGDFSASGSWTLNDRTPTTARCAEANIDTISVVFYDGDSNFEVDSRTYDCADGSFSTSRFLLWGDYDVQWEALQFDGSVSVGPRTQLAVFSPTSYASVAPADFVVNRK